MKMVKKKLLSTDVLESILKLYELPTDKDTSQDREIFKGVAGKNFKPLGFTHLHTHAK